MNEFTVIKYSKDNNIARIILNRPEKRNAVNADLARELNASLLRAKEDAEVKAIIITGAGSAFSAGVDLAFFRGMKPVDFRTFMETFYEQMTDIQRKLGKPTIAALNGSALAAGCTIAFSCDMIIASEKAFFGYPEINVGLMPSMHLALLPGLVGRYKAFELCLLGERITAEEAFRLGMINKVVPHGDVQAVADEMAKKLASKSPLLVKYCKDELYRCMDVEFEKAIMLAIDLDCVVLSSEDTYEGLSAFVEKRAPVWKGR
jgi:enoyl-CoA hydratase